MYQKFLILVGFAALVVVACSSNIKTSATDSPDVTDGESAVGDATASGTDPELGPDEVVFVWSENGGCAQMGPNCARYEITTDGTVRTYRVGEVNPASTGSISKDDVKLWLDAVANTDLAGLAARVGPGELTAAFDGIDLELSAPHAQLALSSVDMDFDRAEPIFDLANTLARLAGEAAPLETVSY